MWVPLSLVLKGTLAVGKPGSGKTALMSSLIRQAIASGKISVIFFNPKTVTNEVYANMENSAAWVRRMRKILFSLWRLTLTEGRSSHVLNVFTGQWERFSPGQQTQVILAAMAISFSREYGVSFFGDAAEHLLRHLFEAARRRGEVVRSFKRLHELCEAILNPRYKGVSEQAKEAGQHSVFIISRLAKIEAIGSEDSPPEVLTAGIDYERFVTEPCGLYCDLNAFVNPLACGELARLMLKGFFSAISTIERRVPVLVFLDEFSLLVAEGLGELLRTARATNVGLILATQSLADLNASGADLLDTVLGTTHLQAFFSADDPTTARTLLGLAGKRSEVALSVSESTPGPDGVRRQTVTHSQTVVDRLTPRELELLGSHRELALLRATSNEGLARFDASMFAYRWRFDRTPEQYDRLLTRPWPAPDAGTIVVGDRGPRVPGQPDDDFLDDWEPERLGPTTGAAKPPIPTGSKHEPQP